MRALTDSPPDIIDSAWEPSDDTIAVKRRLRHHWTMLLICLAVVLLAFALRTRDDQLVEFRWLRGIPMPETCVSRSMFGIDCPGCGLTRSFIALAGGHWSQAWQLNRVGWLLAAAVVIQFPYRLRQIARLKQSGLPDAASSPLSSLFSWTLIIALIGNWLLLQVGI